MDCERKPFLEHPHEVLPFLFFNLKNETHKIKGLKEKLQFSFNEPFKMEYYETESIHVCKRGQFLQNSQLIGFNIECT